MNKLFDKSIEHMITYINEAIFHEKYARVPGVLQNIEPRIKIISLLTLIFFTLFTKNLYILVILNIFAILLAKLSKIPILTYIKRVYIFIPIFAGLIAFPVIFNIVTPGKDLFIILNSPHISITFEGVMYFITFIIRISTCISFAVLIPLTTKWNVILSTLRMFKVPEEIVTIFNLAYRYIFLLLNLALDILYSRKSRTAKKLSLLESWKEGGKIIGCLFINTCLVGEELYYSMLSRGFKEVTSFYDYKIKFKDIIFLIFVLAFILILKVLIWRFLS
ncbi:cobalt ABC transporter, inner membrane subunit CbiQ [Methanocaldococcus villosus KIN24-T80]|uniref:Cobalt ABC transporter, inner membrane subunit CbiQ n=1 Tax=Methanocaldococcus villosus KIN24-T80 TaxID=1069083 RepID=N6UTG1_9EURY|nr:cobalt ECF transporter T component CbiQ [Methanocaldococcus villosus]ENN95594.1 cobalt ABC transporter, inner membrane subunit CbiQ [Methanocaldococcus villosus KIN24-T80]